MTVTWFRMQSWHASVEPFVNGQQPNVLCGRRGPFNAANDPFPPGGKSCESCLRSLARKVDESTYSETLRLVVPPSDDRITF